MRRAQEDHIDPSQPALIVVYGTTKRKCRPLLGDVVVLGRAPGCDIGVVSPEVAPVHCLIIRSPDGWRIRDCAGRSTRLNGQSIRDEPLKNGDIIQVGTFSFEAHLPAVPAQASVPAQVGKSTPAQVSPRDEHLKRSRRRFAERALRLRERVLDQERVASELAQRESDLELMERRLRQIRPEGPKQGKPDLEQQQPLVAEKSQLDARARELNHFAQHLRRQEERLCLREQEQARQAEGDRAGFESGLTRLRLEMEQERSELLAMRQALQQRQDDLEATVVEFQEVLQHEREQMELERDQIVRERHYLDQQRQDLIRQREELQRLQAERPVSEPADLPSTRETWSDVSPDRLESARRLLRELAERRKAAAAAQGGNEES